MPSFAKSKYLITVEQSVKKRWIKVHKKINNLHKENQIYFTLLFRMFF